MGQRVPALWKIIGAAGKVADTGGGTNLRNLRNESYERYRPFYERIGGGNI